VVRRKLSHDDSAEETDGSPRASSMPFCWQSPGGWSLCSVGLRWLCAG
jgi:hypothetical protein